MSIPAIIVASYLIGLHVLHIVMRILANLPFIFEAICNIYNIVSLLSTFSLLTHAVIKAKRSLIR